MVTAISKLISRIECRPVKKDVKFSELQKYLEHFGYELDRCAGSHHQFLHETGRLLTIPKKGDVVKPCYVKEAVSQVGEIKQGGIS